MHLIDQNFVDQVMHALIIDGYFYNFVVVIGIGFKFAFDFLGECRR